MLGAATHYTMFRLALALGCVTAPALADPYSAAQAYDHARAIVHSIGAPEDVLLDAITGNTGLTLDAIAEDPDDPLHLEIAGFRFSPGPVHAHCSRYGAGMTGDALDLRRKSLPPGAMMGLDCTLVLPAPGNNAQQDIEALFDRDFPDRGKGWALDIPKSANVSDVDIGSGIHIGLLTVAYLEAGEATPEPSWAIMISAAFTPPQS